MLLSDVSIKRPVFASVISLLLIAFGLVAFERLPLREYPDIDPPVVTVSVDYPGAAANIVETQITEIVEQRVAGVEGIRFMSSTSEDGRSRISIEFDVGRNIDAATNDVRDRVSGILDNLPEEADPPEVTKADSSDEVIIWFSLVSEKRTVPELTDYAERYVVDRFSVVDGVSQVRIGGQQSYALRVWVDRDELASRNLTIADVESALRSENVELPAGSLESVERQFTARVQRTFRQPEQFKSLVLGRGADGYLVRLGDVARVERGVVEDRTMFRGNGAPMVGLGIIKQSTANTIAVAKAAGDVVARLNDELPEDMQIVESYDLSVFISAAIHEVYVTLFIAIILVILVIYAFLGSLRATLVPAVAVPVSIIATFLVLYILGFSVNLLTLLALVLGIGLVVDDAIIVLENIVRRMKEENETPLVAAFNGTRQVGFAVVATTMVLVAVFVPITFLEGNLGRLFGEFAIAMAASVCFSGLVALTLSPMLASKILKKKEEENIIARKIEHFFDKLRGRYARFVKFLIGAPLLSVAVFAGVIGAMVLLFMVIPSEYAPKEDRGAFNITVTGPEGASYAYIKEYMDEIEQRLMPYVESGEFTRLIVRAPGGFGQAASFNSGAVVAVLADWSERRDGEAIMNEVRQKLSDLPGVRAFPVMRQGLAGGASKPVQFVIGGGTYEELAKWRDILLEKINENNPGLLDVDWDYKETKPQLNIEIDYDRAAELGVSVTTIGRTLESSLGSRRVTTYIEDGEEYDVIVEGERDTQRTPSNIENIYVRSDRSGVLIPLASLVTITEFAESKTLNRYNRVRAITLQAGLEEGYTLGEALKYLETLVRDNLPEEVIIDYKGQSQEYKYAGSSIIFVFILGLLVVYLILAAQFESWMHPFVIMLTVPLAMAGGLLGLWLFDSSLNIYSQIGLIALIGLAAKNGILIVEFANQLRDEGMEFVEAVVEASQIRLRPIMMTSITAAAGAVPLIIASGAGSETRAVIGIVIALGVLVAAFFTLIVIPVAYTLLARRTGSPHRVSAQLERELRMAESDPDRP